MIANAFTKSRLRTAFEIRDDLHEYAQAWLQSAGALGEAKELRYADGALVSVLHREGHFQVELCCVAGGTVIPDHIHPLADTIEVPVAGLLRLRVNGVDPFAHMSDERLRAFRKPFGIRINHDDWHGTEVANPGSMFLSIQRWVGEPKSVLTDYAGQPLGATHKEMIQ